MKRLIAAGAGRDHPRTPAAADRASIAAADSSPTIWLSSTSTNTASKTTTTASRTDKPVRRPDRLAGDPPCAVRPAGAIPGAYGAGPAGAGAIGRLVRFAAG